MTAPEEAVAVCFSVSVDKDDLGSFNSCEGLGCEFVIEQREEGGNNGMVWQLPTRIKYPNVKLSRPVTRDSQKITNWISGMASRTCLITSSEFAVGSTHTPMKVAVSPLKRTSSS